MRVLGIVFVALIYALAFGGAASAHSPVHHEQRAAPTHADHSVQGDASRSTHAVGPRERAAAALAFTALALPRDIGSLNDMSSDVDLSGDCCGVACHAAIGGRTYDNRTCHLPLSAIIAVAPSLHGSKQGRLERPPRIL
jgi:hypothetical protein